MRIYLFSALAIVSFGLVAAQPAAASTYWSCMGPEVACGSSASPSGSSYNYRARERVYAGETERRASGYRANERRAAERPERQKTPARVAAVNPRSEAAVANALNDAANEIGGLKNDIAQLQTDLDSLRNVVARQDSTITRIVAGIPK